MFRKSIRNWKVLVAGLCLAAATLSAATSPLQAAHKKPAKAKAAVAAKAPVSGLFWKATSPTTTIYLLGSIHIGSKAMYPLPAYMEDDFKKSTALIVEVDLTKLDQGKMLTLIADKGKYPEGDTLYNHVSKDTEKQIKSLCEKYSFPEMIFSGMKPWLASMMAQVLPLLSQGMQPDLGIDNHFMAEANKMKKPVEQVETAEFQLNLLASMPDKVQDSYLESVVKQTDTTGGTTMNKLVSDWIKGDSVALASTVDDSSGMPEEFSRKLLQDRNVEMVKVAEKYLKGSKPCFFVVGAAHYLGKEGILELLKKDGYTIQQVLNK